MQSKRVALAVICALWAGAADAVPSRLDSFHSKLARIYRDFVRQESRVAANKTYIRSVVKYAALKTNTRWPEYIQQLAYVDGVTLKQSDEAAQKAFWINSYNSFVMDAVVKGFPLPVASVNEYPAGSFRGSAAWNAEHYAGGGTYTLDSIRTVLTTFRDPRVFFAIHDAAAASPALPNKPYDGTNVELMLEQATTNFLNDPLNFRIDRTRNRIVLSEIFRTNAQVFRDSVAWISTDAAKYPADVRATLTFLLPRMSQEYREYVVRRKPMIEYGPFNWELNAAQ